jgi:hypothetical protein
MNEKICKNCKYWGEFHIDLLHYCTIISNNNTDDLASASCFSEGIGGELITKENFGCMLFEFNPSECGHTQQ